MGDDINAYPNRPASPAQDRQMFEEDRMRNAGVIGQQPRTVCSPSRSSRSNMTRRQDRPRLKRLIRCNGINPKSN